MAEVQRVAERRTVENEQPVTILVQFRALTSASAFASTFASVSLHLLLLLLLLLHLLLLPLVCHGAGMC
jgi:hypothetical protein